MIKIGWDIEEIVALIFLYKQYNGKSQEEINDKLLHFSKVLNNRASILGVVHDSKYRNFNGVKLMYQNVEYLDTKGEKGLSSVSDAFKAVFELYNQNPTVFKMILEEFNLHFEI